MYVGLFGALWQADRTMKEEEEKIDDEKELRVIVAVSSVASVRQWSDRT